MPFDPNLPIDNSPMSAPEMRAQFNGLKDLIDTMQVTIDSMQVTIANLNDEITAGLAVRPVASELPDIIFAHSSRSISGMSELTVSFSTPPTPEEVDTVVEKLNALIVALQA